MEIDGIRVTEDITSIEAELKDIEAKIFTAANDYAKNTKDAANKRVEYDVEYAKTMIEIHGRKEKMTVDQREAEAVVIVQRQMTDCRIAEAIADGSKRHLDALQAILSSIQTRSKLIQTERSLVGRQI